MKLTEISAAEIADLSRLYVGMTGGPVRAPEPVEAGAVRRYAQAIGDEKPAYRAELAPPLFPTWMFRRPLGEPDPVELNAANPDFDGVGAPSAHGLPPIVELAGLAVLNGGIEVEFFRHARHGDEITVQSSYLSIEHRAASRGPLVLVVIRSEYRTGAGDLLLRVDRTGIRRKP
jgi:hypothetical protein